MCSKKRILIIDTQPILEHSKFAQVTGNELQLGNYKKTIVKNVILAYQVIVINKILNIKFCITKTL